jgi:hypothetical protein
MARLTQIRTKNPSAFSRPSNKLSVNNIRESLGKNSSKLVFSFEFFDRTEYCFSLGGVTSVCDNWFVSLLDTIKELSSKTWVEAASESHYNIHDHDWGKTNFKFNFDFDTLYQLDCYQFALSAGKGRVHGFKIDNIFYVYWLDPNHKMYDVSGYPPHMTYKFNPMPSCMELMEKRLVDLLKENGRLVKDNNELNELLASTC